MSLQSVDTYRRKAAASPLLVGAVLLAIIKLVEFVIDPHVLLVYDSPVFLRNAVGLQRLTRHVPFVEIHFVGATRSFTYGWLIRAFAIPLHSFPAIVAMQLLMGGITAWILMFVLLRYVRVRPWVALLSAVVFAVDPVQLVHEHLVMAETVSLLATAVLFLIAFDYLEAPRLWKLVAASLVGVALVSFRVLYVPVVFSFAVILPIVAFATTLRRPGRWRLLALSLLVSCAFTMFFQAGFRRFTGRISWRQEPAYNYQYGYFLLAEISPLLQPEDSPVPAFGEVIRAQRLSATAPLTEPLRDHQLWRPDGLIARFTPKDPSQNVASNRFANQVAWNAIRRDPLGYVKLGVESYLNFWRELPQLAAHLDEDNGTLVTDPFTADEAGAIKPVFAGFDYSTTLGVRTPSRRWHLAARYWVVFLLLTTPFLTVLALLFRPANLRGMLLLFVWSGLVMVATCMGGTAFYRYLHPFSFPALASCAVLLDIAVSRFARSGIIGQAVQPKQRVA